MTRRNGAADNDRLRPRNKVLIIAPGGLEHGGGIGRQMGYFLEAYQANDQILDYQVVDSRGPWFLGASPLQVIAASVYLALAMFTLVRARFSTPCLAHINITGRGSTIRKIILSTLARALGIRYVLHVHDYDYAEYYRRKGAFLKKQILTMFRHAEAIIVLGRRDLHILSELFQVNRSCMMVLHNAVPDPGLDLNRRPVPESPCHLLFLGRLSDRKGVPDLLRALASPSMKRQSWIATLAGDGPIEQFRHLAENLGILERLRFTGWLEQGDVSRLCAGADVLVLPSHAEGLAMSVLEGLSHGLAVITTPVGAHSEVIESEVSGILVPPGDVAALTHALGRVIEDERLRNRLAMGARDRFLEGFHVRRYAAQLEQLHARLFAPRGDHPGLVEKGV